MTISNNEVFKDAKSVEANKYKWNIFDLNTVKNCAVIKDYKSFYSVESKTKTAERYVDQINLQFEFIDGKKPVEINFYTHILNHISEIPESEQNARKWVGMISKRRKK